MTIAKPSGDQRLAAALRPVHVRLADPEWRARAACRDEEPELFFADDANSLTSARSVCWRCPVVADCLRYALAADAWGVWAGTTKKQRDARKHGA